MKYSTLRENFLTRFENNFRDVPLEIIEIQFTGDIIGFFVKLNHEKQLESLWEEIIMCVATDFQANIENEFSTWNMYLFFLMESSAGREIKYRIENDTFCCRKIIVSATDSYSKIIEEHILNTHFTMGAEGDGSFKIDFEKNDIISKALQGKIVKGKRKKTDEAWIALDEIITALKSN